MYYVIVGIGPNSVEIPCLIFKNKEKAKRYLIDGDTTNFKYKDFRKYFTDYYDGCGECFRFELREVQEGVPFIGWNLD